MTSMSASRRAIRRSTPVLFQPPGDAVHFLRSHVIDTHMGRMTLEWRPGIAVWRHPEGQRWAAEFAHELGWKYVCPEGNP